MQKKHLRKAAILLGAAEKLRGDTNFFDKTFTLEDYNRDLELLRSHLLEPGIAIAWSEGQSMSFDQAWSYLLKSYG